MARKGREIYLDGELFTTLKAAMVFARGAMGVPVIRTRLLEAADKNAVLEGPRGTVKVSWKKPRSRAGKSLPPKSAPVRETKHPARAGERRPLLRYPPGEGPLYTGSRVWI
jgi:hypothetical protein